jgi:hypothetical protein
METKRESNLIKKPLAYRIYPLPSGTDYCEDDLCDEKEVEKLFDYAQILEVVIFKEGWEFLIAHYGYEKLFDINQKSGWFDCEDVSEFELYIEEVKSWDKR